MAENADADKRLLHVVSFIPYNGTFRPAHPLSNHRSNAATSVVPLLCAEGGRRHLWKGLPARRQGLTGAGRRRR